MEASRVGDRLLGRGFVLTRPAWENRAFSAKLRRRGAEIVTLAPFRIVVQPRSSPLASAVDPAEAADVVGLASRLAVRNAFAAVPDGRPRGRIIAQGPATARALAAQGICTALPNAGHRSEDLFQHPWLATARRMVRSTGEDGRDWLVRSLRERGVDAVDLPVCLRLPNAVRADQLRWIDEIVRPQLVVSNREALVALPYLLGAAYRRRLAATTSFVSSERLAALAKDLGCIDVMVAASAPSADLIAPIERSR